MGNCLSDPSKPPGKGQKLGSGPAPSSANAATGVSKPPRNTAASPPRVLGGSGTVGEEDGDARGRALKAAEERAKSAQGKGVNSSNPKAGKLSAQLQAERKKATESQQGNERMMDRGEWN